MIEHESVIKCEEDTRSITSVASHTTGEPYYAQESSRCSTSECDFASGSSGSRWALQSSLLPPLDYPTPVVIRNTFIDTPVELEDISAERRAFSAPVSLHGGSDTETEVDENL